MSGQPGRTNTPKHGGEMALASLQAGVALRGPAADSEAIVRAELETQGRGEIVTRAAVRLESVARLFYNAFVEAADRGDLEKMDCYAKRYGWLQTSALRAWQQVKNEEDTGRDDLILDAVKSAQDSRKKDNGDTESN